MNGVPAVSVVIPTYNYARYLPEAVESVLAQDFRDFELLVADDASPDDTAEVMAEYVRRDPRVRFVRHEKNLGMVENWNWCLAQARGRYVKFLMGDDRLQAPHALGRMVEVLEQHPDVVLVATARLIINDTSQPIDIWNPLGAADTQLPGPTWIRRHLATQVQHLNAIGEPSATLFRRDAAGRGFDPGLRQLVDLEMWLHLLQHGDLYYLAEPLCCFRRHSAQQTEVNRAQALHEQEELQIYLRYQVDGSARFYIFCRLRRLARCRTHDFRARVRQLDATFSWRERAWYTLRYRLWRLACNFEHSMQKRWASLIARLRPQDPATPHRHRRPPGG